MTVDRHALERRWIHSHEEDTAEAMVFRPDGYAFPPSRGRLGFELRPHGGYVETAIGPADRPEEVSGTWTLEGDTIVVTRNAAGEPERRMHVVSTAPDRLVVARD
jgi:hypothetical protein